MAPQARIARRARAFAAATVFIDMAGLGIVIPVMPRLIAEITGASSGKAAVIGGWLLFAYAAMQFLFSPIIGRISDRLGRRPVLLAALGGLAINYVVMALATNILWLFIGRLLSGVTAATYAVASASLTDVTPLEDRARRFGQLHAALGAGLIVGPALGGLLGGVDARVPFWVAAGLIASTLCAGCIFFSETRPPIRDPSAKDAGEGSSTFLLIKKNRPVLGLLLSFLLVEIAFHSLPSTWSFYAIERFAWDTRKIGYSLALYGLLIAIAQASLPKLIVPRMGLAWTGAVALALASIAYLGLAFLADQWSVWLFIMLMALGTLAFPTLQAMLSEMVDAHSHGALQGMVASTAGLAAMIGPVMMTQIFRFYVAPGQGSDQPGWPGAPFFIAALLAIVSSFIVFGFGRRSSGS